MKKGYVPERYRTKNIDFYIILLKEDSENRMI